MGALQELALRIQEHPEDANRLLEEFLQRATPQQDVQLLILQVDRLRHMMPALHDALQDYPAAVQRAYTRVASSLSQVNGELVALADSLRQALEEGRG